MLICSGAILLTLSRPWFPLLALCLGLGIGEAQRWEHQPPATLDGWADVQGTTFSADESVLVDYAGERFLLYQAPSRLCPGDKLYLNGRLRRPVPSAHPGTFDPWRHLFSRGARSRFAGQIIETARVGDAPLCKLRQSAVSQWYRALQEEDAWLAAALTVGAKPRRGKEGSDAFRRTGLAHLLAVSGLHIGFALAFGLGLLRWLPAFHPQLLVDKRRRLILGMFIALGMTAWCGWPVGGIRILSWLGLAWLLPRRSGWTTGLLSLSSLLLFEPQLGADAGFLLSHTAALLLVGLPWARSGRLQSAFVAGVGTFPLLWCLGFSTSPLTPLTNLLFMPFFLVIFCWIWIVFGITLISGFPEILSLAAAPLEILRTLALFAVSSPLGWQVMVPVSMLHVVLCSFLLVAWLKKRRLAVAALLLVMFLPPPFAKGTRYWQLPVGHGDLALLKQDETSIVIDTGPSPRRTAAQLFPLLGSQKPDLIIVSHEHPDHIGGLGALCRRYPSVPVRLPEKVQSPAAKKALESCRMPQLGHEWAQQLGGLQLRGLPQPDDWVRGANNRSLALDVRTEGQRWLFLGDIEADRELDLLGRLGTADGIKVPHHGSRTSSSPSLIHETKPRWAVLTAGRDDPYKHPHPAVTDRYTRAGARVLSTEDRPVCLLIRSGRATRPCPELAFLRPGPLIGDYGNHHSQSQPVRRTKSGLGRQW